MSKKTAPKRINFATSKILEYPDLLEVQIKSFKDFFQLETTPENRKNEGLFQVFQEIFPIEDTRNNYKLEFIDYFVDPPKYSIEECLQRGLTYNVPLKAKLRLSCTDPEHEDFDTRVQDVYLGDIPYMTPGGTFVINGSERIVVSQLHRSPGVFFDQTMHANGTKLYSARIIPFKGSWIEFATDINNVMYAYIDRKKKLPVTTLLRAIGFNSDKDIIDIFDLADEVENNEEVLRANAGRKLAAKVLKTWTEDFEDEDTGEIIPIERTKAIVERGEILDDDTIAAIMDTESKSILLQKDEANSNEYAIIFNTLQKDPTNTELEAVNYIYKQLRNSEAPDESTARDVIDKLFFSEKRYDLGAVGRYRLNKKLSLSIGPDVRVLTNTDIIEIIKYLIQLIQLQGHRRRYRPPEQPSRKVRRRAAGQSVQRGSEPYGAYYTRKDERPRQRAVQPHRPHQRQDALQRHQFLLRNQPAEPVHGPDQPSCRDYPQEASFRSGPRRPQP